MKLLLENWRKYLAEEDVAPPSLNIQTMGDLRGQIKKAKMLKRGQQGATAAKDAAGGTVKGAIVTSLGALIGFPLGGFASVADLARKAWSLPDNKVKDTGMDHLQIDNNISAIVSDEAENKFLNNLDNYLGKLPDETPLKTINMNKLLQDFLAANYGQRTITAPGLQETKK